jgi:hypothetical protein
MDLEGSNLDIGRRGGEKALLKGNKEDGGLQFY